MNRRDALGMFCALAAASPRAFGQPQPAARIRRVGILLGGSAESSAARIDLEATNTKLAYGADRSSKMDFSEYDRIDDFELNEILWRAIKGKDAPVPPAVRRAIAYRGIELPDEK